MVSFVLNALVYLVERKLLDEEARRVMIQKEIADDYLVVKIVFETLLYRLKVEKSKLKLLLFGGITRDGIVPFCLPL